MHKTLAMEVFQCIQNRAQHVACFFRRKRPLRQNLRKVFFGVLHHQIQQVIAIDSAPPRPEQSQEIQVRQLRRKFPTRELQIRSCRIRREKFYGSFLRLNFTILRKEDRAVIGSTKILPQGKNPFDVLTFPLFRGLGHIAPPPDRAIRSSLGAYAYFVTSPWKGIWLDASILPILPALSTDPQTSSFFRFQ